LTEEAVFQKQCDISLSIIPKISTIVATMKTTKADGSHYFGMTGFPLSVRRVKTDTLHEESHPHDLTEIEHSHDFCELVVVTKGSAIHRLEGRAYPVSAGDVFLLQGRQRHYFNERRELELINIMYDPAQIVLPESELRKLPGYCAMFILEPTHRHQHRFASRLHLGRIPLADVERLADEMERELDRSDAGCEVILHAKLMELIVYLSRAYSSSETVEAHALLRVGNVICALEREFAREWNVADLMNIAHMSRSNLMRVFRRATGRTPIEYLIRIRIQKAIGLLRSTNLSVTEIAMETGFNDSNYFSRQFRRVTGRSPRKFRGKGQVTV